MTNEEQYSLYLTAFVDQVTDAKAPNPYRPPHDDVCECALLLPRDQEDFEYAVGIRKAGDTPVVN